ncbi:hypothetical protein BST21_02325 [Mycolicibacterium celeriflavum]|nr:hypothetical protein BST21_02325 [Mycolicibacterium celeriflavum]
MLLLSADRIEHSHVTWEMVRREATHSSFLPAFHSSACFAACAYLARRLETLLIVYSINVGDTASP